MRLCACVSVCLCVCGSVFPCVSLLLCVRVLVLVRHTDCVPACLFCPVVVVVIVSSLPLPSPFALIRVGTWKHVRVCEVAREDCLGVLALRLPVCLMPFAEEQGCGLDAFCRSHSVVSILALDRPAVSIALRWSMSCACSSAAVGIRRPSARRGLRSRAFWIGLCCPARWTRLYSSPSRSSATCAPSRRCSRPLDAGPAVSRGRCVGSASGLKRKIFARAERRAGVVEDSA